MFVIYGLYEVGVYRIRFGNSINARIIQFRKNLSNYLCDRLASTSGEYLAQSVLSEQNNRLLLAKGDEELSSSCRQNFELSAKAN